MITNLKYFPPIIHRFSLETQYLSINENFMTREWMHKCFRLNQNPRQFVTQWKDPVSRDPLCTGEIHRHKKHAETNDKWSLPTKFSNCRPDFRDGRCSTSRRDTSLSAHGALLHAQSRGQINNQVFKVCKQNLGVLGNTCSHKQRGFVNSICT